jgi:hypothetical protein
MIFYSAASNREYESVLQSGNAESQGGGKRIAFGVGQFIKNKKRRGDHS